MNRRIEKLFGVSKPLFGVLLPACFDEILFENFQNILGSDCHSLVGSA